MTAQNNSTGIVTDDGRLDGRKLLNVPLTEDILSEAISGLEKLKETDPCSGADALLSRCYHAKLMVQLGANSVVIEYPGFDVNTYFNFQVTGNE